MPVGCRGAVLKCRGAVRGAMVQCWVPWCSVWCRGAVLVLPGAMLVPWCCAGAAWCYAGAVLVLCLVLCCVQKIFYKIF